MMDWRLLQFKLLNCEALKQNGWWVEIEIERSLGGANSWWKLKFKLQNFKCKSIYFETNCDTVELHCLCASNFIQQGFFSSECSCSVFLNPRAKSR